MGSCCHNKEKDLEKTVERHRNVLWIVLVINALMFFVEMTFGLMAQSVALVADSLDMLGDAVTYGTSIVVVGMGTSQKASVAKLKAWIMLIFGLFVAGRCILKAFAPVTPEFTIMVWVGLVALGANLICLWMLNKFREDDINMKSVWICSRNDIIANTSVLLAALVVSLTASGWPDLLVGCGLTVLFVRSAMGIFADVRQTRQKSTCA